jgi:hypothetical protein
MSHPAAVNDAELIVTKLVGDVTSPSMSMNPYEIAANGTPFVPVGTGGVCYSVKVGMTALGWAADQVEPGASIANPDPAANEALLVYACVGNPVVVRTGAAAGAEGIVTGKHEAFMDYKHVLVHLDDEVLEQVVPGDRFVVRACGRGLRVEGLPELACHSLGPELWHAWRPRRTDGGVVTRVTRVLPPEVVGMGSGRVSAVTSIALQPLAADLEGLRLGDLVAVREWDATYVTGYHEDSIAIGVVSTGDSPVSGNGPGVTLLLSGPASSLEVEVDEGANLADLLGIV